jgi:NAD(P)-dependent dehydrogenase (short-subunit alcohol dehydrogenase family)
VLYWSKKNGGESLKIAVVDGQGGGIGRIIVEKLRHELGSTVQIVGLGTNAVASSVMLKAGANEGASGENAVVYNVQRVDCIVGSVAIIAANSFAGELSPRMAEAIATVDAVKILIPINKAGIQITGTIIESLPIQVDQLIERVHELREQLELY